MKKVILVLAVVVMVFVVSAEATLLTFTHEGTGSGTLDGELFPALDFVITATGDTGDRLSLGIGNGWWINHISASISIDGLGDFDFLTGTRTFVNNDSSTVGFSRANPEEDGWDLFNGPTDAVFNTWDMLGPIGPISGLGHLFQWGVFPQINTTEGILFFDDDSEVGATFTATPEPGTMVLLGLGGLMLRRKHN